MPTRGVQNNEELEKARQAKRKKKIKKIKTFLRLSGLSMIEFVLCFVCLLLAILSYMILTKTAIFQVKTSMRHVFEPPCPVAISSVFLAITYLDIISWISMRPITYFAWIMVASAGFLLFFLYAGCLLLISDAIITIIALVFACITGLVFLMDLVCLLLSMKRFPIPHWVLKRKHDKLDECVCTGDYDPNEEKEVERPLCHCGDNWGHPCDCDAEPDPTCGCGADKVGQPPCPCCECADEAMEEEENAAFGPVFDAQGRRSLYNARKSMVSTYSGRDFIIEEDPRKSVMAQVQLMTEPPCNVHCIDGPMMPQGRKSVVTQGALTVPDDYQLRQSMVRQSMMSKKSATGQSAGNLGVDTTRQSVSVRKSMSTRKSEVPTYNMYSTSFNRESIRQSLAPGKPILRKSTIQGDGPMIYSYEEFSSEDEYGEAGDYPRMSIAASRFQDARKSIKDAEKNRLRFSAYTTTEYLPSLGSMSDPEFSYSRRESEYYGSSMQDAGTNFCKSPLPGQVPYKDDLFETSSYGRDKRNVSVTARILDNTRKSSTFQNRRSTGFFGANRASEFAGRQSQFDSRASEYARRPSEFDRRQSAFDRRPSAFDRSNTSFDRRPSQYERRASQYARRPSEFNRRPSEYL